MHLVSAALDLQISQNAEWAAMAFTRLACAYSSFLPEEHEKIKRVYLLFDMPFNKALLETHSRLHKMEQLKIANYIDELRQHLDKVEDMQLKLKMALHLINVVDAVRIDQFFAAFILKEEARLHKQPYFDAINNLPFHDLLTYIDSKIRALSADTI